MLAMPTTANAATVTATTPASDSVRWSLTNA
jgi:hypothetical protein